ncbi:EF-hand domain-containing protein [Pseudophaeobacter flagellatus]|uniref:EF-hand domain-containing protein n=1 Tax=Pseudophaeobacter flagellatus TaxID=2899119 RepID=UPI001E310ED9|nr:EF-hand domain-containing protein [Pseudophaeobacter flagellatus]MCD9148612.1 EF-hand domain-containing protein [Pseudophaeobacter flagellatus]
MSRIKIQTKPIVAILATAAMLAATTAMAKPGFGPMGPKVQFEELDSDGNGEITKAEMEAHKAADFGAADSNGDGKLSAEELQARGEERLAKRVAAMIRHMDQDDDGQLSQAEMSKRGHHGDMFARMDRDDNGSISQDEFGKMRHHRGGKHGGGHGSGDEDCSEHRAGEKNQD